MSMVRDAARLEGWARVQLFDGLLNNLDDSEAS
jgi:hypothetical protein